MRPSRDRRWAAGLLFLALSACGNDPVPPPQAPPGPAPAPLAEAPRLARARFWFQRIATGPLPRTDAFEIRDLHRAVLEQSVRDLIALPEEALELFGRPENLERFAGPGTQNLDPLHAFLDVL